MSAVGSTYYSISKAQTSLTEIPIKVEWVKTKTAFLVINAENLCGPFADHSEAPVGAIFLSPVASSRHSRLLPSRPTPSSSPIAWPNQSRRLSLCVGRAAAVPSFPSVSIASVLSFNVINGHAFAHSFTILAFSSSYRNTIFVLLKLVHRRIFCQQVDTVQSIKITDSC
ncbi:hypothetical protein PRIPAC_77692 [Pristionchus pacificus]|uniref:Uncharacterized protein n=1 Tax=Pristionchus pacificus TaxID=54126 RepID=A0A2A6CLH5_PRIPA|nr:hypothetical protein PRIPAC_77692 [Pristionchus pacificus]|eukprot:PDM78927.1 hypothetical protein PRIPAC_31506 [Pristionchus pacificus]